MLLARQEKSRSDHLKKKKKKALGVLCHFLHSAKNKPTETQTGAILQAGKTARYASQPCGELISRNNSAVGETLTLGIPNSKPCPDQGFVCFQLHFREIA